MSTKIEWTDETWQVTTGCSPVSTGCRNCYAARMAATRLKHHPRYRGLAAMATPGRFGWTGEIRLNHNVLDQPLHWKKPRRVFVASMGDLFHKDVPDKFIHQVFDIMAEAQQHTFQVLTKRPDRMKKWFLEIYAQWPGREDPFPNVWLGVSVENQAAADERIPLLLQIPAEVRFVSCEPLLGPVDLSEWLRERRGGYFPIGLPRQQPCLPSNWHQPPLDWVIVGGESGPGARPMHPQWPRNIRDQCQAAGVPFFGKQASGLRPGVPLLLDGREVKEWPNLDTNQIL